MIITNTNEADSKLFPAFYGSISNFCPRCEHLILFDIIEKDRYCPKCGWREVLPDSKPATVEEQKAAVLSDPILSQEGKKFYQKKNLREKCEWCGTPFGHPAARRYCGMECRKAAASAKAIEWRENHPEHYEKLKNKHAQKDKTERIKRRRKIEGVFNEGG